MLLNTPAVKRHPPLAQGAPGGERKPSWVSSTRSRLPRQRDFTTRRGGMGQCGSGFLFGLMKTL